MQFFDAGTLNPGRSSARELTFWRTVHGPVIGYARVRGRLVALARKRASYGKDVLDLLFYHDLAHGQVHNVHQFFRAASLTPNPPAWRASATAERITFVPGLLPYTMRYTNRPSGIQQILSFFGHSPQDTGR